MERINAGYRITDHISVQGQHYCLGENPTAPAPYVTWRTNEDMSYFQWGRYFAHREPAIADMVLRATWELEREDGIPLAVDFLQDNARDAIIQQYIREREDAHIQYALKETGMARSYEIDRDPDCPVTVTISEDESLRRIGNSFVFRPDFIGPPSPNEKPYQEHDGEICTVLRALTPEECDILCSGMMWEAEFSNGERLHLFDRELELPGPGISLKRPLSQQISSAQNKTSAQVPGAEPKAPQR